MSRTDEQLMTELQAGDQEAFAAIVDRHGDTLRRWTFKRVKSWETAEDLTQETFLRIYQHAERFTGGSFTAWMYRIALNLLIDAKRKSDRRILDGAAHDSSEESDWIGQLAGPVNDPAESAENRELVGMVYRAIDGIADEQAYVLLSFCAGRSLPELSDEMACPLPTSKSRLRLARENVRERLGVCG